MPGSEWHSSLGHGQRHRLTEDVN